MNDLYLFIKPLILTILFEGTAAWILGYRTLSEQLRILFINAVTNPMLVYFSLLLMYHLGIGKATCLIYLLLEPMVILIEYLYYRKVFPGKNCFLLSVTLNLISILGGLLCQKLF